MPDDERFVRGAAKTAGNMVGGVKAIVTKCERGDVGSEANRWDRNLPSDVIFACFNDRCTNDEIGAKKHRVNTDKDGSKITRFYKHTLSFSSIIA